MIHTYILVMCHSKISWQIKVTKHVFMLNLTYVTNSDYITQFVLNLEPHYDVE